ncbi:hypothetical protein [Cytobacillus praedii]|uniref:hypothetical protein n=1 Tax=Cytobacillus praedii TaxID=1742358 RepID=UPI00070A5F40|nr:hypothetical protein [Cytobacillus praedii]
MSQFLKQYILIALVTIISGCSVNDKTTNSIKENVLSAFEEEGIELSVKKANSNSIPFDYPNSKESIYQIDGGRIYCLFYGYDQTKQIEKKIRATLAETEFLYPLQVSYYDKFAIIFIPTTDNTEITEKVDLVLDRLK